MFRKFLGRQAYHIASVMFIIVSFVYFTAIMNRPYVGLELKNINGQWIVIASDPYGEGYRLGIRAGDVILKIDDVDTGKYHFVQKWGEAEGASSLQVRKLGQPIDTTIKIPKHSANLKVLSELPMIILGFVFWFLGFMTWMRRSFLVQAQALFWLNWFIGLAIVLAPAASRDLLCARELEYIIFSSVPIFLIHFFSVFPSQNKSRINNLIRILLTFIFVIIVILTILQSAGIGHSISLLRRLVLSTVTTGILLALWNIGARIKLPIDRQEKNQASILLLGMAIGFLPFALFTAVPIIFDFQPVVSSQVSSLFVSAIPATLWYVIVHKYLPDSRRLLGMTLAFSVAAVITSFIVSYLLIFLRAVKTLHLQVYLTTLSMTMLYMVCVHFLRVVISKFLQKFVFEEKNDFKKRVLKLSKSLSSIHEEEQILEALMKSLSIEGVFIVVEDGKGSFLKKAVGRFSGKFSEQARLEEFFQTNQKIGLEVKMLPDDFPAALYIPFVSNYFACGVFLGHRDSRVRFERYELSLITLISRQLAQRFVTLCIIQELSKEIKDLALKFSNIQRRNQGLQGIMASLFRSFEKEKKLIAFDIHDGPLQLGLDLNRWLKYLGEECLTNNDEKTMQAISHMQELVENLNFELRLICNDLRPPSLNDLGLLTAIELMCEEIRQKELLIIFLETKGIGREERFKEEVEVAAYRFLQEGITNAVKHSGSDELKIHIEVNESRMELTIQDSGKGFDISKIEDWSLTDAHLGIVGMKERIEGLGGELQISSTIHRGTILKATIPIM